MIHLENQLRTVFDPIGYCLYLYWRQMCCHLVKRYKQNLKSARPKIFVLYLFFVFLIYAIIFSFIPLKDCKYIDFIKKEKNKKTHLSKHNLNTEGNMYVLIKNKNILNRQFLNIKFVIYMYVKLK